MPYIRAEYRSDDVRSDEIFRGVYRVCPADGGRLLKSHLKLRECAKKRRRRSDETSYASTNELVK